MLLWETPINPRTHQATLEWNSFLVLPITLCLWWVTISSYPWEGTHISSHTNQVQGSPHSIPDQCLPWCIFDHSHSLGYWDRSLILAHISLIAWDTKLWFSFSPLLFVFSPSENRLLPSLAYLSFKQVICFLSIWLSESFPLVICLLQPLKCPIDIHHPALHKLFTLWFYLGCFVVGDCVLMCIACFSNLTIALGDLILGCITSV